MEMTFPHFAARHDSAGRPALDAMLAVAVARQANSRTVRVVRLAENSGHSTAGAADLRIGYFARAGSSKMSVYGAFWREMKTEPRCEQAVYQAGSNNIKVLELKDDGTGEQFNHAGHGALRKS
jgi:hypothetical protein